MHMVENLKKVDSALRDENYQVAAVGPKSVDSRTAESGGFLRFVGFAKAKCFCDEGKNYCPTDSLMFSGMLIKLNVFAHVGLFDESLFMDNLDTEWGLRAKSKGWHSFGACKAILEHHVGDHVVEYWGRKFYIHNPLRQYYIFRNRIVLYKRSYIPLAWKINDLAHIGYKILLHTFAIAPRREYLKNIFRGIWDGLLTAKTQRTQRKDSEFKNQNSV